MCGPMTPVSTHTLPYHIKHRSYNAVPVCDDQCILLSCLVNCITALRRLSDVHFPQSTLSPHFIRVPYRQGQTTSTAAADSDCPPGRSNESDRARVGCARCTTAVARCMHVPAGPPLSLSLSSGAGSTDTPPCSGRQRVYGEHRAVSQSSCHQITLADCIPARRSGAACRRVFSRFTSAKPPHSERQVSITSLSIIGSASHVDLLVAGRSKSLTE